MANGIRSSLVGAILAGLAALAATPPAMGQRASAMRPPEPSVVDPEIEPFPYDPRLQLRELFRQQMPTYWWFEEPEFSAGAFTMVVHLPVSWRGNPTGEVMKLCPDHDHPIWKGMEYFFIRPFYQKRPWPTFECRP